MKFYLTILTIISSLLLYSQDYSVEMLPSRYRLSWENVHMKSEKDLGFVGIGFDLFHITGEKSNFYAGVNTYSAVTGIRPGLITFGVSGGWQIPIIPHKLFLDTGSYIGGGGGGGAEDGGGLIIRPHLNLEARYGNMGFQAGISHLNFVTGNIHGTQFNVGITVNGANFITSQNTNFKLINRDSLLTNNIRVAIVGTQYYNFKKGSAPRFPKIENGTVGLLGIQISKSINPYSYGMLKLNGAMSGGADGYMNVLIGGGGKLPLLKNNLSLEARLLGGPSGGGGIESGGGATAQAEAGFNIHISKNYDIGFMMGKTWSPWGAFKANHFEINIGKSFEQFIPKIASSFKVANIDVLENKLGFSVFNRTYFPPHSLDKNKLNRYKPFFNLIGFEIQKYIGKRFSLNGATVWAYQGEHGAYAEGLLGATYYHPIANNWNINLKTMIGAAGGGAIDLGGGLISQFSLGSEKKISNKWIVFASAGKFVPLSGNFSPLLLDLGVKFNFTQLMKNNQ